LVVVRLERIEYRMDRGITDELSVGQRVLLSRLGTTSSFG
jgi:hypothetical protein